MPSRPILMIVVALGLAGWLLRDTEPLRSFLHPSKALPASVVQEVEAIASPLRDPPGPALSQRLSSKPRKCLRGSEVIYTNEACPPGTREQALTGGTITVVPGTPVPTGGAAAGGAPTASGSGLRELAGVREGDASLRDRMIERGSR